LERKKSSNSKKGAAVPLVIYVLSLTVNLYEKNSSYGFPKIDGIFNMETNGVNIHIESILIQAIINLDK